MRIQDLCEAVVDGEGRNLKIARDVKIIWWNSVGRGREPLLVRSSIACICRSTLYTMRISRQAGVDSSPAILYRLTARGPLGDDGRVQTRVTACGFSTRSLHYLRLSLRCSNRVGGENPPNFLAPAEAAQAQVRAPSLLYSVEHILFSVYSLNFETSYQWCPPNLGSLTGEPFISIERMPPYLRATLLANRRSVRRT